MRFVHTGRSACVPSPSSSASLAGVDKRGFGTSCLLAACPCGLLNIDTEIYARILTQPVFLLDDDVSSPVLLVAHLRRLLDPPSSLYIILSPCCAWWAGLKEATCSTCFLRRRAGLMFHSISLYLASVSSRFRGATKLGNWGVQESGRRRVSVNPFVFAPAIRSSVFVPFVCNMDNCGWSSVFMHLDP